MQEADAITTKRLSIWNRYDIGFEEFEHFGLLRRPVVPTYVRHNAHMYYLLLRNISERTDFIETMKQNMINCVFHYVPLHSSPAGKRYSRAHGSLSATNFMSERLVRLPLFFELSEAQQARVLEAVTRCLK